MFYKKLCGLVIVSIIGLPHAIAAPSGQQTYERYCAGCHETGTANAPRRNNTEFWKKRLQAVGSPSALVHPVIQGKGAMPPKGGCFDCTEDMLRHSVNYLLADAITPPATPS